MGSLYASDGSKCCAACGAAGARTIRCTHRITYPPGGTVHGSGSLPYCSGPDLCRRCCEAEGGPAKIHARCKAPARARQAELNAQAVRAGARP